MKKPAELLREWLPALVMFVVLFGLLKYFNRWELEDNALEVGTPLAAFSLPDAQGRPYQLPPPGRRVLINYWAAWCQPCLKEMPILADFSRRTDRNGTQVVGIALDLEKNSKAWLGRHPLPYPVLFEMPGIADSSVTLGNQRGLLPFSVLVGADGRVLATRTGPFADLAELQDWADAAD
jgi:peroxiredoxin